VSSVKSSASFPELRSHLSALIESALREVAPGVDCPVVIERPKQASHGDYACNVALQLAKPLRRNPRDIAATLVAALPPSPHLAKAEVAGGGFINLFLAPATRQSVIAHVLERGARYGESAFGAGKKVLVEFVSANPTGPLHVGHGRGAAYGASLANVLAANGFEVLREYYVNDAGRQMDILAVSTWLRYLELHGLPVAFPPNAYQGDYVQAMAVELMRAHGERFAKRDAAIAAVVAAGAEDAEAHLDRLIAATRQILGADFALVHGYALERQLSDCREDLLEFGVTFDRWYSERSLFDSGKIEAALRLLESRGHIYEKDGARWFRSSAFGDEKDRVLQRANRQYTYFASDIAYHLDKVERGFALMIDIWGADHHGYIARVKGALEALGADPRQLAIALVQFAVLYRGGSKVSMSTRAGNFVTLRELRREVGNDAARLFYVLRKSDQHLDFDLDLAKSQSNENPVYYVQYAHARVCSLLEQWGGDTALLAGADPSPLTGGQETGLLSLLIDFPAVVEGAGRELAPHLIAFHLKELAAQFHSYYNATRVLVDDEAAKLARLALAVATRQVLRNGLALLGVAAPEKM
jgi:arginyl-tRNA synthetase